MKPRETTGLDAAGRDLIANRLLWVNRFIFGLVLLLVFSGFVRSAFYPLDRFLSSVIIDDATYNLIPARNLLDGFGYSFDRLHRTNGVQPLWALVSVAVVALCPDLVSAMRVLVLAGGLCWIAAGILLFKVLSQMLPGAALLASTIWLMAGFTQRNALQGMENGITGLCLALFLYAMFRTLKGGEPTREFVYPLLGMIGALISVCRVELLMLPVVLSVLVALGRLELKESRRDNLMIRQAILTATPTLVIFGVYILINVAYFGSLLPVSGAAKQFYNSRWLEVGGWPNGGFWGNVKFHFAYAWDLAVFPLTEGLSRSIFEWFHLAIARNRIQLCVLASFGTMAAATAWIAARGWKALRPDNRLVALSLMLSSCVLYHFVLLMFLNPFFTLYGIWYFTPQIMELSILLGAISVVSANRCSRIFPTPSAGIIFSLAPCLLALLWVASNARLSMGIVAGDERSSMMLMFKRSGEWLQNNLPGVQRVGTVSSGVVNVYARRHHVVNLDGLMNTLEYLRRYLIPARVPEYLLREKIDYYADYAPTDEWRGGISYGGPIPPDRLHLLRWWLVPDGHHAYAIWRILPVGTTRKPLSKSGQPGDRISELQWASLCMKLFPTVAEDSLQAYVMQHPNAFVATSVQRKADGPLEHIMMTTDQYRALRLEVPELDISHRIEVSFAASVRLLGFDAQTWELARGQRFVFTRYWQSLKPLAGRKELTVDTYIHPYLPGWIWHRTPGLHGTLPLGSWLPGDVFSEHCAVTIPLETPPGVYPIHLGIWEMEKGWLPTDRPADPVRPGMVFVGNLTIR